MVILGVCVCVCVYVCMCVCVRYSLAQAPPAAAAAPATKIKINRYVAVAAAQTCDVKGDYNTAFAALSGPQAVALIVFPCKPKSQEAVLAVLEVHVFVHTVGASISLASLMLEPPTVFFGQRWQSSKNWLQERAIARINFYLLERYKVNGLFGLGGPSRGRLA